MDGPNFFIVDRIMRPRPHTRVRGNQFEGPVPLIETNGSEYQIASENGGPARLGIIQSARGDDNNNPVPSAAAAAGFLVRLGEISWLFAMAGSVDVSTPRTKFVRISMCACNDTRCPAAIARLGSFVE